MLMITYFCKNKNEKSFICFDEKKAYLCEGFNEIKRVSFLLCSSKTAKFKMSYYIYYML